MLKLTYSVQDEFIQRKIQNCKIVAGYLKENSYLEIEKEKKDVKSIKAISGKISQSKHKIQNERLHSTNLAFESNNNMLSTI